MYMIWYNYVIFTIIQYICKYVTNSYLILSIDEIKIEVYHAITYYTSTEVYFTEVI